MCRPLRPQVAPAHQIFGTLPCLKKFRRGSCEMPDHRADRLLLPRLYLQPRRRKTQRRSSPPPRRRHAAQRTQGRSCAFASLKDRQSANRYVGFFNRMGAAHREFVLFRLKRMGERTEPHRTLKVCYTARPPFSKHVTCVGSPKRSFVSSLQRGSTSSSASNVASKTRGLPFLPIGRIACGLALPDAAILIHTP